MFAEVSFPISSYKTFTYKIPDKFIKTIYPGLCVNAPIGNRTCVGFVVEVSNHISFKGKVRCIKSIKSPLIEISDELMKTILWTSKYYLCPIGVVLKAAIPNAYNEKYSIKYKKFISITDLGKNQYDNWRDQSAIKQIAILQLLLNYPNGRFLHSISETIKNPYAAINSLNKKKLIYITKKEIIPNRFLNKVSIVKEKKLSKEQNLIYNEISKSICSKRYSPFLIHGVPGSGKTEIYIKLAKNCIENNKRVLVLVPEISLTPQLLHKFQNQFTNRIALWHSKIKIKEKGWVWQQLYNEKFDIVIGARSAIFLPIKNLGLIIVDEEHEFSYKQSNPQPRYNARDLALVRSNYNNIPCVLGSATPCLETYYNSLNGKIKKLELRNRYGKSINPKIQIVNMNFCSQDLLISSELEKAINKCLENKEQIIIFHNRRGYSVVQRCSNCSYTIQCKYCSINLTYHKSNNKLVCHHCKNSYSLDFQCHECGHDLILLGAGTQKIEKKLHKLFPKATILRMDSDTVKSEQDHIDIINSYEKQTADILIGTQMVAKGLDFKNVTLVGVINADMSLSSPDFRTGEKIFQLLYQVCGRSGRHEKKGKAIIQTNNSNNPYIKMASDLNISQFYNIELSNRFELYYPPASRIVKIVIKGKNIKDVIRVANELKNTLINSKLNIQGPIPAPIEKIKSLWRYLIIIKENKTKGKSVFNSINVIALENLNKKVKVQFDVDPVSLL